MKLKDIIKNWLKHNQQYLFDLKSRKQIDEKSSLLGPENVRDNVLNHSTPLFCLSTGRAGTKFLTEALNQCNELNIFHEPEPEFIFHNKWAYECEDIELKKASFDAGRYELMRDSFLLGKAYMETNTRIAFYAPAIAQLYPKSKFIYLQRDCKAFVKSGLGRNWYGGHVYDEGRIIHPDTNLWNGWSQVEKITWLWCETNNFIESFLKELDSSRYIRVEAKEMFTSSKKQDEIQNFIGVNNVLWPTKKVNKGKVKNKGLSELQISQMNTIIEKYYIKTF